MSISVIVKKCWTQTKNVANISRTSYRHHSTKSALGRTTMFDIRPLCGSLGRVYLVLLVLFTCALPACLGQVTAATISGSVKDETGAVLPNAGIEVTNVETGVKRTTVSQA